MSRSLLLLAPAVFALLLVVAPSPAQAALPIGLDIAGGVGGSGTFDRTSAGFDLHLRAELRLGFLTLGASLKDRPPLPRLTPANRLMIYGELGFNVPLPKARLAFRFGLGGGKLAKDSALAGAHETAGLHIFAVPIVGIGLEVDFEQTWLMDVPSWEIGMGGRVLLLIRI